MSKIHKFSLVYDADEDRIALDTEDLEGATTRLWLTQRLCRGLVKALLPMLQTHALQKVAPEHLATLQSFEQAAAMAQFGRIPPVRPQAESAAGLVKAVHIQPSDDGLVLTFDFGSDEHRVIGLAHAEVRQTLTVLHGLQKAGGWALDLWPSWITDPAAPSPADAVN
jgi:hypothetical protein